MPNFLAHEFAKSAASSSVNEICGVSNIAMVILPVGSPLHKWRGGNRYLPTADVMDFARGNRHLPTADVMDFARGNRHLPTADVMDLRGGRGWVIR